MEKKRILICGDPLSHVTGLAYVSGSFARYFMQRTDKYEVGYFSLRGKFQEKIRAVNPDILDDLKIYVPPDGVSLLEDFTKTVNDFNPHIVLTVADPWDLEVVAFNQLRYSYCWIAYTTIEVPKFYSDRIFSNSLISNLPYRSFFEILNRANLVVPVTQMGKNTLRDLNLSGRKLNNICDENVFCGLDVEDKVISSRTKKQIFNNFILDDEFLFMSLGVNSERKRIEQVIIAFAKFIERLKKENNKNYSKIKLYLHTNTHSAPSGTDLRAVIDEYDIKNNIVSMSTSPLVDKKQIYELYSVCDVYIGLPGGEGFGMGFAESMLHEKPVIYIDHGGHTEFAYHGGLSVKVKDYIYAVKLGVKWALPDINHAVDQMYKLYKNEALRKQLGKQGSKFVEENLSWNNIGNKLEKIILDYYDKTRVENLYGLKFKKLG